MKNQKLWVALVIVLLTLLGSSAALYARFYNVEWRIARVEHRLMKIEDKLDRVLQREVLVSKER